MTGKLLGAALIGAAAVWGFAARQRQLRQRRELVSSLQQALGHMASAIRCQRQPMTPLLTELARRQICGGYAQLRLRQLGEQREQEDRRDRRLTGAALFSAAGLLVILLI